MEDSGRTSLAGMESVNRAVFSGVHNAVSGPLFGIIPSRLWLILVDILAIDCTSITMVDQ